MERMVLAQKTHNASHRLHPSDPVYEGWILQYTLREMEKDLGARGDITSSELFPEPREIEAVTTSNSSGILAGVQEITYFLIGLDPIAHPQFGRLSVDFLKKDCERIEPGDQILRLRGDVKDILKVERIILNLLQRMSGIATLTSRYTDLLKSLNSTALLVPTRKTVCGLLDKRAVVIGGGGTHRLDLSDATLIKDNHATVLKQDIAHMLRICAIDPGRFLEIEVETKERALEAARAFHWLHVPGGLDVPGVIMFDNMRPSQIREAIAEIQNQKYESTMLLYEASGGIRYDNLELYANCGVDIISVGEITHSAMSLDFSMEIIA